VLLTLGSAVLSARAFPAQSSTRDRIALQHIHDRSSLYVVAAVLSALSLASLAVTLWYLFRVTRHRRPELPSWLEPLIWIGPVLFAAALALGTADQLHVASVLVKGEHTEVRANHFTKTLAVAPRIVGQAGAFAIAISLVMVSLNAIRVGLLTRFLGIIGVVIGALLVLPILPGQVFQIFWLGALAAVFMNKYPGGRGESWASGEPGQWLSAAEARRAQIRESRGREQGTVQTGGIEDPPLPEPDEDVEGTASDAPDDPEREPHPTSKKRRKKRRR
jgi:hypothetical protein